MRSDGEQGAMSTESCTIITFFFPTMGIYCFRNEQHLKKAAGLVRPLPLGA